MSTESREQAIERMLRHGTAAPGGSPATGPCLDGETLAAWTTGALRPADAARIDDHLSSCSRCQSMAAVFARTERLAAPTAAWWQRWQVRWLVPVAAAATVAAIYVATPDREIPSAAPAVVEMKEAPRARATDDAPGTKTKATAQSNAAPVDALQRKPDNAAVPQSVGEAAKSERRDLRDERAATRAVAQSRPSAPAVPLAAAAEPSPATAAPPAASAPATLAETVTIAADAVVSRQERSLTKDIASSDKATLWRIVGGQRVERSTTAGADWRAVEMPAAALVTAGHAPTASIVWLVGPGGAVYLTTDGSRFVRIPFVDASDLASVVAINDGQATVTTVDGRRFETADRGATWARR